jgi:hypothetical protein
MGLYNIPVKRLQETEVLNAWTADTKSDNPSAKCYDPLVPIASCRAPALYGSLLRDSNLDSPLYRTPLPSISNNADSVKLVLSFF